jgi:hypothetical protein
MEKGEFKAITEEHNETMLMTEMTLKMIKVLQGEIKVSNQEIQEMITYFQGMEKYIICDRLKKLIKQ